MLAEPAGLKILWLYGKARRDVLGHAVEPFALLGCKCVFRVALGEPCLIARPQFVAVGHQSDCWDQRMAHQVHEVRQLLPTAAFDLIRLNCLEGTPELHRRR